MRSSFTSADSSAGPLLAAAPDARRAPVPLPEAFVIAYIALLFGATVGAALALAVSLALRRWSLAAMVLLGGIFAFAVPLVFVHFASAPFDATVATRVVLLQMVHAALGVVLAWKMHPHLRGHAFLGGRLIDGLLPYGIAFGVYMLMPGKVLATLLVGWVP